MISFGNILLLMHSTDTENRGRESVNRNETLTLKPSLNRRTKRRYAIAKIRKKIRIVEQKTVQR